MLGKLEDHTDLPCMLHTNFDHMMHRLLVIACPVFDILAQIDPKVNGLGISSPTGYNIPNSH